jgi:hypothetical protein
MSTTPHFRHVFVGIRGSRSPISTAIVDPGASYEAAFRRNWLFDGPESGILARNVAN